jgi:glycosyltransferase involved in cell wall biosynthesis
VPCAQRSLRLDDSVVDQLAHHVVTIERVQRLAPEFDIIHFHCDYLHFPLSRRSLTPTLTTLHGRLDLPDLQPLYREYVDMPLASISYAQRAPLPDARWMGTVHHGLPPDLYRLGRGDGGYLAYVGRISPEKRPDRAVAIARKVGLPLVMGAKVDRVDRPYFEEVVRPLLKGPGVEWVGEVDEAQKGALLRGAVALLFPVEWPEPFGLAMIEAMACGTPVVATHWGAVPEVIDPGVTGFVVQTVDEAVSAVESAAGLDRLRCRVRFLERFTAARMARDYVTLYAALVNGRAHRPTMLEEVGR